MTAVALLRASPVPASDPTSAGLTYCAGIASPEARLACYDALAGRSTASAASGPAPGSASPAPPSTAPPAVSAATAPAPGPPVAAAAAAATIVAAPTPLPAPVAPQDPAEAAKNFGLSSAQVHSAPQGLQFIEARVSQVSVDRGLRSYVVLDNGQSWLSTDGGMDLIAGEQVSIKRAALGSFMLVSTVSKHSYHVRRLR